MDNLPYLVLQEESKELEAEIKVSITGFIKQFLMGKEKDPEKRKSLFSAFHVLNPVDMTDAMFCANLVYAQHMLHKVNTYMESYELLEKCNNKTAKKYQWSVRQAGEIMNTICTIIEKRRNYKKSLKGENDAE